MEGVGFEPTRVAPSDFQDRRTVFHSDPLRLNVLNSRAFGSSNGWLRSALYSRVGVSVGVRIGYAQSASYHGWPRLSWAAISIQIAPWRTSLNGIVAGVAVQQQAPHTACSLHAQIFACHLVLATQ